MDFTKIPEHQVTTIGDVERGHRRRYWLWVGLAVAVVAGAALVAFLMWQARQTAEKTAAAVAQEKLGVRAADLEKNYRALIAGGDVSAEALATLDQAILAERERLQLDPTNRHDESRHLEKLEAERDDWLARAALPRLASLEAAAQAQREAGEFETAVENLRKALALQRVINGGSAAARLKDYIRETRLAQALSAAEAEPLQRDVRAALARAADAEAKQQWVEARQGYVQARAAQVALNRLYPGSRFADTQTMNRIEQELASLQAADSAGEITSQERRGDESAAGGRAEEAALAYAAAAELQAKLNQQFARSRFASTGRIDEFETKRQAALAAKALAEAQANGAAVTAALRRRDLVVAAALVAVGEGLVERIGREWPRSAGGVGELKVRLAYLSLRQVEWGALQEEVLGRLVPLPGSKGLGMLATEVSQELYTRVMNTNPSRNAGRGLPVDSVSLLDARGFCERLGWVLGRRVRLPTEPEWRAAVGAAATGTWTQETSGGHSRETGKSPANAAGFFDLNGNVAEWLEPADPKGALAPIAGGSFLDRAAATAARPLELLDKGERARQVGFRIVVDLGG